MTRRDRKKQIELRNRTSPEAESNDALDILLALDRFVLELSMSLYNIPRRERFTVRKQNRRLHGAVRKHMPRLLGPHRNQS